jgi:hypothetical protein
MPFSEQKCRGTNEDKNRRLERHHRIHKWADVNPRPGIVKWQAPAANLSSKQDKLNRSRGNGSWELHAMETGPPRQKQRDIRQPLSTTSEHWAATDRHADFAKPSIFMGLSLFAGKTG